jgi:hypothetical protein
VRRSSLRVAVLVLTLLALVAPPAAAAPARGDALAASGPTASRGAYSLNLYRDGDFVPQHTGSWCIGASMQTMLNIMDITDDASYETQERFMVLARTRGRSSASIGDQAWRGSRQPSEKRGAGSGGWARGLVAMGAGRYEERVEDTYDGALRAAAEAIRITGRPVGLIVWRGKHAWVVSGFTATADPVLDRGYRVTGVFVQDPWYPRRSNIWGRGKRPNSWISVSDLREDFLPRRKTRRRPEQAGKYVLVLPVLPRAVPPGWAMR